jgi:hypothetical protein
MFPLAGPPGDHIVNDLMKKLDPLMHVETLECASSSKTGRQDHDHDHIEGCDYKEAQSQRALVPPHRAFGQPVPLIYIQGSDEANENCQKKDLTISGVIFKYCILLV